MTRDDQQFALIQGLITIVMQLVQQHSAHQAWLFALQAYLEARPDWNIHLWTQLLEKYQTQGPEGFQRDAQKVLDALQTALREFEGPRQ